MADSATTRNKIRLSEVGVKTAWGGTDGLNEVIEAFDEKISGYITISLTGDYTLTSTQFESNEVRNAFIHYTDGGLSAIPTVDVPQLENVWWMYNAGATYAITLDCGGTTASIPVGIIAMVRCDGTDMFVWNPVALTAADVVLTGLDVDATNADVVSTGLDVVSTAADVVSTGLDVVSTAADAVSTAADAAATALDETATAADAVSTASDATDTGVDATATAADAISTAADAVSTASDATDTGVDAAATAADAILTAADVVTAAASEAAAAASAASINLPAIGGSTALDLLRVNAGKTGYEFLTLLDEDDMVSDSATKPVTQQSLKAYVDASAGAAVIAILEDQKSSGTSGGTSIVTTWTARDLNTEVFDGGSYVSIASNKFTPTVACSCQWETTFRFTGVATSRLYNVTDSTVTGVALNMGGGSTDSAGSNISTGFCQIEASKEYRVEYYVKTARATDGLGGANNITSTTEVYTIVHLFAG